MIYNIKQQIPSSIVEYKFYVANCVKCGSEIQEKNISEYEDMYGFISTIECIKCKNKIKTHRSIEGCIKEWNLENDIPQLIESKTKLIADTKQEIINLKKLFKSRSKNVTTRTK